MQDAQQPALVLARWNSWVRVWLPASGEIRWVDLGETAFEPLSERVPVGAHDAAPRSQA